MTPFIERRRDIAHIGPVEMFTPRLEATRDFFVNQMALREVHRDEGSIYLHAWDDYQRYTLRIIQREDAGIGRTFLRAASPQALQRLVERIETTGLGQGYSDDHFGLGPVYLFDDPDGHPMGVYWDAQWYQPDDTDRPVLKNQAAAFPGRGANVRRLDHINYLTKEIDPVNDFVTQVLGAFCTERIAREGGGYDGVWFTVTDKTYDLVYTRDWLGARGRPTTSPSPPIPARTSCVPRTCSWMRASTSRRGRTSTPSSRASSFMSGSRAATASSCITRVRACCWRPTGSR